jgi:hypothetical protein
MRVLAAFAALAIASPAAGQVITTVPSSPALQMQLFDLQSQAELARQRDVAMRNELTALESRLQTEQGLATVRAQAYAPRLPSVDAYRTSPNSPLPNIDTSKLASIPDSALAASNKRVQEAAQNRR